MYRKRSRLTSVCSIEPLEGRTLLSTSLPAPDHVVVVIEENHSYGDIIGSSIAPYINSLAEGGANFTSSYAVTHPSQPNYLELFSGASQGVSDDSLPNGTPFSTPNLGAQLVAAGKSFTGYAQGLPYAGSNVETYGNYARKHNPWVNWQSSDAPASNHLSGAINQPFTSFPSDFTKLPTLSIVTPDLQNDMHDGSIEQGDQWLQNKLGAYANWAKSNNSLLVVTWDEDDFSQDNQIPTIFYGANVKAGNYSESIDHHSVLRTLEEMYDLPFAGSAAGATAITDVWTTASILTAPAAPSGLLAMATSESQIDLSWIDNSNNETGFTVDRATDSSFTQNLVTSGVGAGSASYHTTGLNASTTYYFRIRAANDAGVSANSNTSSATTYTAPVTATLPAGWSAQDIGSPALVGTSSSANGTFTIAGAGNDIWNTSDQFQFASQPLSGDGTIVARVNSITPTDPWAKAGVMIRESSAANSPYIDVLVTPSHGASIQYRTSAGAYANHIIGPSVNAPYWVKLVRSGNTFSGWDSRDGTNWSHIGSVNIAMPADVAMGLAVTSHNTGAINTSTFDHVSVTGTTVQPTPTPQPAPIPQTQPLPTQWSAPITITSSGHYSGNWQSLDPNVPAVTIDTDEPVTIVNSIVRGAGTLIKSNTSNADITLLGVSGYGLNPNIYGQLTGYFLNDDMGVKNLDVEMCYMEGTRGLYLDGNNSPANKIRIWGNRALNIDGRHSDGNGGWITSNADSDYEIANFVQFQNMPSIASAEIAWNQVKNVKGQSRVEDVINVYRSSGTASSSILIHDNFIDGAYKTDPTVSDAYGYAGGGILVDYGSNYVRIYDNQVLNTTNYGVAINSGHDNTLQGNRVLSDELLPDTNVGVYIWNEYGVGNWGNDIGMNNQADWANGNDWWNPNSTSWSGNSHMDSTSASEYQLWQQKLSGNNIVLP